MGGSRRNTGNDHSGIKKARTTREAKRSTAKWLITLGTILGIVLATSNYALGWLPKEYLRYLEVVEAVTIGYFVLYILGNIVYSASLSHSEPTAKSFKSLVRIVGAIVIIAFVISFLSQDPLIATSISTISGIVIGFAASNLIGNAIAGIYLAIVRPFRIGDILTVFGYTATVYDISLLYTKLLVDNGDIVLSSNSSMVTTTILIKKGQASTQAAAA
jgi:small-conductance mechanosensitive channel